MFKEKEIKIQVFYKLFDVASYTNYKWNGSDPIALCETEHKLSHILN